MNLGIDISTYQNGINLNKAKEEDVTFVIIRAGFTGYANKSFAKDDRFEEHYKNARQAGLKVGAYYYSRATSYEEGQNEAKFLYENCLKNKTFEYPIYIDVEDSYYQAKTTKDNIDQAISGFCDYIEEKNGYAGVYCNLNWANNFMNYNKLSKKYDFWLAYWGKSNPKREVYGDYGMWQYGGETNLLRSNKIDNRVCDQNYSYKDYENIMTNMKLNNFKEEVKTEIIEEKTDKTINFNQIYDLIKKVIDYIFSKLKKGT